MTSRTIAGAARELQSAANRLALMRRDRDRDTILATLFPDVVKGQRAAARLTAQGPGLEALEEQVRTLRRELGGMLDQLEINPDTGDYENEPPKRKRSKK